MTQFKIGEERVKNIKPERETQEERWVGLTMEQRSPPRSSEEKYSTILSIILYNCSS